MSHSPPPPAAGHAASVAAATSAAAVAVAAALLGGSAGGAASHAAAAATPAKEGGLKHVPSWHRATLWELPQASQPVAEASAAAEAAAAATAGAATTTWGALPAAAEQAGELGVCGVQAMCGQEEEEEEEEMAQVAGPLQLDEGGEAGEEASSSSGQCSEAGVAWRYRFANRWRRARRVSVADALLESPDPISFLKLHGAGTAGQLAAGGAPVRPSTSGRGVCAGVAPASLTPHTSRLARGSLSGASGRGSMPRSTTAGGLLPLGTSDAGCSSLGGSYETLYSGGEMHARLVTEARRAQAALDAHLQAQLAPAHSGGAPSAAGGEQPARGSSPGRQPPRWVGCLLPATALAPEGGGPGGLTLLLARVHDAQRGGEVLVLRGRPRASAEQLLQDLRGEVAAAAAAAQLPATACVQYLGSGRLERSVGRKVTIMPASGGWGALSGCGVAPQAFCSTAAALLRHTLPCDHAIVQLA